MQDVLKKCPGVLKFQRQLAVRGSRLNSMRTCFSRRASKMGQNREAFSKGVKVPLMVLGDDAAPERLNYEQRGTWAMAVGK